VSRREPVAPLAHGGQRSADAAPTSTAQANRVPSATKFLPQRLGPSLRPEKRRLSRLSPSRGRFVAADSSAIHTRRLRKGTTRRFREVIYVTERAGATGNEDILSVHSDVRAQAMLQAQDLVLGFARFLGGSFAGSPAAGVSTDASGGLACKKSAVCLSLGRGARRPSLKKASLETCHSRAKTLACDPECEETIEASCA